MERYRQIFYVALCFGVLVNTTESGSAIYELIHDDNARNIYNRVTEIRLIHKTFHRCSLVYGCNYVVWKMKTNEYKVMRKMPLDLNGLAVWKKIQKSKAAVVEISNATVLEGAIEKIANKSEGITEQLQTALLSDKGMCLCVRCSCCYLFL